MKPWHAVLWLAVALLTTSISRTGVLYPNPTRSIQTGSTQQLAIQTNTSQSNNEKASKIQGLPIQSNRTLDHARKHPVESLVDLGKQCNPGPNQPLEHVPAFPNYANASSYWNHPSSNEEVVCEFNKDRPSAIHFPHAMQQLYACFSLWQEYPQHRPILLVPKPIEKKLKRNPFLKGILQIFQSQLKVDVLPKKEYVSRKRDNEKQPNLQTLEVSGGYILSQAGKLNHLATNEFQLQENNAEICSGKKPRIGILNRRVSKGRSIINAELLAATPSVYDLSFNNSISVEYFEGLDFAEQISFFRSIDVLMASHGAQLTGLAFMNAPCSQLVELFPKGYAIPYFFGSLAINSGKQYSYLYMSENSFQNEPAASFADRREARSINLCLSPQTITSTLVELSTNWRKCCDKLSSPSD